MGCSEYECDRVDDCRCYTPKDRPNDVVCGVLAKGFIFPCKMECCQNSCKDGPYGEGEELRFYNNVQNILILVFVLVLLIVMSIISAKYT